MQTPINYSLFNTKAPIWWAATDEDLRRPDETRKEVRVAMHTEPNRIVLFCALFSYKDSAGKLHERQLLQSVKKGAFDTLPTKTIQAFFEKFGRPTDKEFAPFLAHYQLLDIATVAQQRHFAKTAKPSTGANIRMVKPNVFPQWLDAECYTKGFIMLGAMDRLPNTREVKQQLKACYDLWNAQGLEQLRQISDNVADFVLYAHQAALFPKKLQMHSKISPEGIKGLLMAICSSLPAHRERIHNFINSAKHPQIQLQNAP